MVSIPELLRNQLYGQHQTLDTGQSPAAPNPSPIKAMQQRVTQLDRSSIFS
jgi:hypothetical protein